jgi:PAS domain S-box-containing protein
MIPNILQLVKEMSGFEAVGIRLRQGEDFPYYTSQGFSERFLVLERHLYVREESGEPVRDDKDQAVLECMCGNVIRGRTDPSLPQFTGGGSFWTNSTTELLASTCVAERQGRWRNCCNGEGYESVALIPLRSGQETIGLLQLNDRRKGLLTPGFVHFLEGIGSSIGVALVNLRRQERYDLAVEGSSDGFWDRPDMDSDAMWWSPRFHELLGLNTGDSEAGMQVLESLAHPDDLDAVRRVFRRRDRHGERDQAEFRLRRPDGRYRWFRGRGKVSRDGDGRSVRMSGSISDIDDRYRTEQALRLSEEKYRAMIDNVGIGVSLIDPEMRILELNKQMREWFPDIDPNGRPVCFRAYRNPPGEAVCDPCPTARTLRDGKVHEDITETPSGDSVRYYRIISSPVRDDGGAIAAAIEMVEDITERHSLEEQLRQAQKLESIGTLAAGVAHDFNNIIVVQLGYCDLMLGAMAEDNPLHDPLSEVRTSAVRAAMLTRQLLTFSRKQEFKAEILDLNEAITNLQKMLGRLIGEDVELAVQPGSGTAPVLTDRGQIEQVVMNLVINARDAMPQGGRLTIETANVILDEEYAARHPGLEPGAHVKLAVTDTGCGMDRTTLARLFEPFFTTKSKGTGLGLATVYGIVKLSGGHILVDSEPGNGSTFRVYLPLTKGEITGGAADGEEVPRGRGEQVLVVEDDQGLQLLLRKMLVNLGYFVTVVADGVEALSILTETGLKPELVLTDVVMPGMGGKELVERLRATRPEIKVLFMSGYTDDVIERCGLLDTGIPCIRKPFERRELASRIRELLES